MGCNSHLPLYPKMSKPGNEFCGGHNILQVLVVHSVDGAQPVKFFYNVEMQLIFSFALLCSPKICLYLEHMGKSPGIRFHFF